ncbi:MAG: hypothetical protein AAF747_06630 [Planctomycetota bacterium]
MGQLGDVIQGIGTRSLDVAEAMLNGYDAERFARIPEGKAGHINTNHAAWHYGHLSVYPVRILAMGGIESSDVAPVPDGWGELFDAGSECKDDPNGSIYPSMADVSDYFFASYRGLVSALAATPDERLLGDHNGPDGFKQRFPTYLSATTFMVGSHIMMHLGSVSVLRRCEGLGSAF